MLQARKQEEWQISDRHPLYVCLYFIADRPEFEAYSFLCCVVRHRKTQSSSLTSLSLFFFLLLSFFFFWFLGSSISPLSHLHPILSFILLSPLSLSFSVFPGIVDHSSPHVLPSHLISNTLTNTSLSSLDHTHPPHRTRSRLSPSFFTHTDPSHLSGTFKHTHTYTHAHTHLHHFSSLLFQPPNRHPSKEPMSFTLRT